MSARLDQKPAHIRADCYEHSEFILTGDKDNDVGADLSDTGFDWPSKPLPRRNRLRLIKQSIAIDRRDTVDVTPVSQPQRLRCLVSMRT